jgi:hypothetical protein
MWTAAVASSQSNAAASPAPTQTKVAPANTISTCAHFGSLCTLVIETGNNKSYIQRETARYERNRCACQCASTATPDCERFSAFWRAIQILNLHWTLCGKNDWKKCFFWKKSLEKKGPFLSDNFVGKSVLSNFTERYVKKKIEKTVFPKKNHT